jgi:C1A family cysteine protease
MPQNTHGLGWIRDLPDHRDSLYSAPSAVLQKLPPKVDLRAHCPSVYDQGHIGSCTANAIAGVIQYDRLKAGEKPDFVPSRLFIYFNERAIEHTVALDNGAQIRDGIKSVAKLGVCPEAEWPYKDVPADPATHLFPPGAPETQTPDSRAREDALKYKVISYMRLNQSLGQFKGCLADGYPFVLGFTVYTSLWDSNGDPKTEVPLPSGNDTVDGGHAVMAVGYDDGTSRFTIRNSWGDKVQDHGYFYMPYAYLTDPSLAGDFWTIRAVAD